MKYKLQIFSYFLVMLFVLTGCNHASSIEETTDETSRIPKLHQASGCVAFVSSGNLFFIENGVLRKIKVVPAEDQNVQSGLVLNQDMNKMFLKDPKWISKDVGLYLRHEFKIIQIDIEGNVVKSLGIEHSVFNYDVGKSGKIYYSTYENAPDGGRAANIYVYSPEDGKSKMITDLRNIGGRRILNVSINPSESIIALTIVGKKEDGISIWLADLEDGSLRMVLRAAADPSWSPDGKVLAYISNYSRKREFLGPEDDIFIYDITTGESRRLTYDDVDDGGPTFSPDGSMLMYQKSLRENRFVKSNLFAVDIKTMQEYQVTTISQYEDLIELDPQNYFNPSSPAWI